MFSICFFRASRSMVASTLGSMAPKIIALWLGKFSWHTTTMTTCCGCKCVCVLGFSCQMQKSNVGPPGRIQIRWHTVEFEKSIAISVCKWKYWALNIQEKSKCSSKLTNHIQARSAHANRWDGYLFSNCQCGQYYTLSDIISANNFP